MVPAGLMLSLQGLGRDRPGSRGSPKTSNSSGGLLGLGKFEHEATQHSGFCQDGKKREATHNIVSMCIHRYIYIYIYIYIHCDMYIHICMM